MISALLLLFVSACEGARILGVFPMPAHSHYIFTSEMMKGFAEAGHHVTMITPYKTKNVPSNCSWEDVVIDGLAEQYHNFFKTINIFQDGDKSNSERTMSYQDLMMNWVNETLYHPKVRALMRKDNTYDAVVVEQFLNDCHKYFAHYFDAHLIMTSTLGQNPWVFNIVGNPYPASYVPNWLFAEAFDFNSISHRFRNMKDYFEDNYLMHTKIIPLQNKILQQAFPGAPSVEEISQERTSLVLVNFHESLLESIPLTPNVIPVGGLHVTPPKKLPQDIQEFLDGAKNGAIYFSLGSHIKIADMAVEKRMMFVNAFKKLNIRVLWKFEDDRDDLPDNIMRRKWLPQNDILAHSNVKVFITHGGLMSTTESVYHGVPVLAVPIFADQFVNSQKAIQYGYGLVLPYNSPEFTEENIIEKLKELLNNPKYYSMAKTRSRLFNDRPMSPKQTAVWWLNFALRHNGAKHLMVKGAQLPFYKYWCLDVIGLVIGGVLGVLVALIMMAKWLTSALWAKKKVKKN